MIQVAESLFAGPVAIGVALGALAAKKGFLLGALIAGNRSNGHNRYRRSPSYSTSHHYDTNSNYHYTRPTAYYYSSSQTYHRRGKRSEHGMHPEELSRLRREVETFNFDEWILEMSSKDQDDCSKKLICELSAKAVFNKNSLTDDEKILADLFAVGLDISKSEIEFSLAAEIGKNKGLKRCKQMYKIQLEIEGLTEAEIEEQIAEEQRDVEEELKK